MKEFTWENPTNLQYTVRHGSKAHILELARLGWSLERIKEYFLHELTEEQIKNWLNE